jgi:hypothetical protein
MNKHGMTIRLTTLIPAPAREENPLRILGQAKPIGVKGAVVVGLPAITALLGCG